MELDYQMTRFACFDCQSRFLMNTITEDQICPTCRSSRIQRVYPHQPSQQPQTQTNPQPSARPFVFHQIIFQAPDGISYTQQFNRPTFPWFIFPTMFTGGWVNLMPNMGSTAPDQYGAPPAQEQEIQSLRTESGVTGECSICQDAYAEAVSMPCDHKFHGSCLEKWLRMHNTCPVCRYSLSDGKSRGSSRCV